jgi:hypothetical protein
LNRAFSRSRKSARRNPKGGYQERIFCAAGGVSFFAAMT